MVQAGRRLFDFDEPRKPEPDTELARTLREVLAALRAVTPLPPRRPARLFDLGDDRG
jgi:hypothetical protein